MLERFTRPTQDRTKAIWTCLGVDPKRLAGHWFSLRDNGIDIIGNRVVPMVERRRLEVGRFAIDFRRLTTESLSRTIGSLGSMAVKYDCDGIESNVSHPAVMEAYGEVFGPHLHIEMDASVRSKDDAPLSAQDAVWQLNMLEEMQPLNYGTRFGARVTVLDTAFSSDASFPPVAEIREPQFLNKQ